MYLAAPVFSYTTELGLELSSRTSAGYFFLGGIAYTLCAGKRYIGPLST